MKLSVIVATYNRKKELVNLLDSFSCQTLPADNFEIVVVDDGSTDGTADTITDFMSAASYKIKYIRQKNTGPGKARSAGMREADGDVFIFIDSDCLAPPNYLKTIFREFRDTDIDAFGGPDRSAEDFSAWDKSVNYTMNSFLTTGGLRGSEGKKLALYYPRSFNMGLRRSVYERIGGFGSIYHYGEDIEYSHRILQAGAKVAFISDAFVYHKRRSTIGAFASQTYKMGKARIQLSRIDKRMLEPLHLTPMILTLTTLVIIAAFCLFPHLHVPLSALVIGGVAGIFFIGLHGASATRTPVNIILIPLALGIQVFAYGLGMISEVLFRRSNKSIPRHE